MEKDSFLEYLDERREAIVNGMDYHEKSLREHEVALEVAKGKLDITDKLRRAYLAKGAKEESK